ncbi:MAG: hypothetical protein ACI4OZ_04045 [Akkermansia sp.]
MENTKYIQAYKSSEFKNWVNQLSWEERERAEEKGLLKPQLPTACIQNGSEISLEEINPSQEISVSGGFIFEREEEEEEGWKNLLDNPTEEMKKRLYAFLRRGGNPKIRVVCLNYLLGEGTYEKHAKCLGISKQAFHYHVEKILKELHLPPLANKKRRSVCSSYREAHTKYKF